MGRHPLVLVVALLAALAGATAIGAASTDDTTIHSCKHLRRGIIRIVRNPDACKRNEALLSWNVRGPQGEPGPAGPQGPAGPVGPAGPGGAGLSSLGSLVGLACTTYDGATGRVDLDVTPENLVLLSCDGDTPPPPPAGSARVVLNEIDYDQVGTDTGGFVEIANAGTSAATLDGLAIVLVNGGDSAEYARKALSGTLAPGAHLAVEVDPQNGAPDGVALLDTGSGTLLDALSYEGVISAAVINGTTYDLVEGTPLPADVADSNTSDGSLSRLPDAQDKNAAAADWAFTTTATPGAANVKTP